MVSGGQPTPTTRSAASSSTCAPPWHSFASATRARSSSSEVDGQHDRDARAVILFTAAALHLDAAAVGLDDLADERESEALRVDRAGLALEEVGKLRVRDAGAIVLDRDRNLVRVVDARHVNDDGAAG